MDLLNWINAHDKIDVRISKADDYGVRIEMSEYMTPVRYVVVLSKSKLEALESGKYKISEDLLDVMLNGLKHEIRRYYRKGHMS